VLVLGIESTAHTLGIGIVDDKEKVLASRLETYKAKPGAGIVPAESAARMKSAAPRLLEAALRDANLDVEKIDAIAFSQGPGLPPTLRVGRDIALEIAAKAQKPLIGVNHCIAHIEIGRLTTKLRDPIILYVSGGNSQVIGYAAGLYRVFGETLDIAVGNALDKFAREVGLGFPGGPLVEEKAREGKYVELPYTVKGMDFAFSGLVTSALRLYKAKKASIEDLCFSIQETAFAELVEVVERALAHTGKSEVLLTGGVAANRRFAEMLDVMCKERSAKFAAVEPQWSGDNGAMIAWAGLLQWRATKKPATDLDIKPRWRTDEVEVSWLG